jgi:uncharacterized repeat protein (TIGR03803 family)
MHTNLERAALAVLGCVVMAISLDGCGSTTTTTSSVTTTTPDAGGSTPGVSTSGGSSSGSTSGGSTSGASTTYTVGGTVSGLDANESVTLLNNGGDAVNVSGDGAFTFSTQQAAGTGYAVTVQQHTPGIACSIADASGTVASSNVTDVAVSCGTGNETVLYSFTGGAAGADPQAGVVMDSSGNLYGTTQQGGTHGHGTVFKVSSSGTDTVLHSFGSSGGDGEDPQSTLVMDSAGNLYGTTPRGGAHAGGTIFEINTDGSESILYSFGAGPDGRNPDAGLVMDSAGNFYGTTPQGGTYRAGTVFELSASGKETILHSFLALGMGGDGQNPQGALVMDSAGNLYGTTPYGGENMAGTVFEVSGQGAETTLYSFTSATPTDGRIPYAGVIVDSGGNIYGTTIYGGANGDEHGDGTVFTLSPAGKETALYSFGGAAADGRNPYGSLVMDSDGNRFGTTQAGGAADAGTVFKLSAAGKETILYSFGANGASDGSAPHAALLIDSVGNLYGTTAGGGAHGDGTVFKID